MVGLSAVGAAARITRLATDDAITEPARRWLLDHIRYDRRQRRALRQHQHAVDHAIHTGQTPPADPPELPPLANPRTAGLRQWATKGLSCRWCTSVWVSTVVILAARRLLAQPSYTGGSAIPWSRQDLTLVPMAALATAYVTGWLADHEE